MIVASLAALLTDQPLAEVMRWSVPRHDQALFEFRAQVFGGRVEAVTFCPACAEQLEMHLAPPQIAPFVIGDESLATRLQQLQFHTEFIKL